VWLALDGELAMWRDGTLAISDGANIAGDARIFASPSGDIWVLASTALARYSGLAQAQPGDDEGAWKIGVLPVYARVCSNCHGPKGSGKDSSNVDLSTYDAWKAKRDRVLDRVVGAAGTPRQMPPPSSGYSITPAELDAIKAWASPK
jgi:mono/diheme cytochrome c family protein